MPATSATQLRGRGPDQAGRYSFGRHGGGPVRCLAGAVPAFSLGGTGRKVSKPQARAAAWQASCHTAGDFLRPASAARNIRATAVRPAPTVGFPRHAGRLLPRSRITRPIQHAGKTCQAAGSLSGGVVSDCGSGHTSTQLLYKTEAAPLCRPCFLCGTRTRSIGDSSPWSPTG